MSKLAPTPRRYPGGAASYRQRSLRHNRNSGQPEMAVPLLPELLVAEGDQGIDPGGAAGWDPAGHDSGD